MNKKMSLLTSHNENHNFFIQNFKVNTEKLEFFSIIYNLFKSFVSLIKPNNKTYSFF